MYRGHRQVFVLMLRSFVRLSLRYIIAEHGQLFVHMMSHWRTAINNYFAWAAHRSQADALTTITTISA